MSKGIETVDPNVKELVEKFEDRKFKPKIPVPGQKNVATFPVVDIKLKEGMVVGISGIYNNQMVVQNTKYKIKRIRSNGTMVLKAVGRFKDG